MVRTTWLTLAVALCSTPNAFSQPSQPLPAGPRFFVSGGILAETDHTWAEAAPAGAAISAAAGVDVSGHVGVRLAVDVPKVDTTRSDSSFGFYRTTFTERHRSIGWSGLIDAHGQLTDRVRLGVLAGISSVQRPTEYSVSRDQLGPGDVVLGHADSLTVSTYTWLGVTLGTELPVSITSHVAVVPEASVTEFPLAEYGRTSIVRAGASFRWRF